MRHSILLLYWGLLTVLSMHSARGAAEPTRAAARSGQRPQWAEATTATRFAVAASDDDVATGALAANDVAGGQERAQAERPGAVIGTLYRVLSPAGNSVALLTFRSELSRAIIGYVLPGDYHRFPDLRRLEGRRVLLCGVFSRINGRPQIRLTDPAQVHILPPGASSTIRATRIPAYPTVQEDPKLLADAVAAWEFDDGGTGEAVRSALPTGPAGVQHWGIWLNDLTFGKVLDFSTEGSYFRADTVARAVPVGGRFSIAAWIKAPPRGAFERIIVSQQTASGSWELKLSRDQTLVFQVAGVPGAGSSDSGVRLDDGRWHHVLVAGDSRALTYYVDRVKVRTVAMSGISIAADAAVYVGSEPMGAHGFDGSICRVRIYDAVKTPEQVTAIAPPDSGNRLAEPILPIRHGIALDRRQYANYVPPENEKVYPQDVENCRLMGFDHMKVLFTPNHLMNPDGSLATEKLWYMKQVVDTVVAGRMRCLICLHPEVPFKQTYLVESDAFEKLIHWYGELARFIGAHWTADEVALQLMTEPYANQPEARWTWMSDRMYGAVRNVLPNHTIITSADRSANLERLKAMRPATDSNLIYSFTTYEPYMAGFNIWQSFDNPNSFWKYLHGIPYPANLTVLTPARIEAIIRDIPALDQRDQARTALNDYATGRNNGYGGYYDADWHRKRAESLRDWSRRYGGVNLMCVEFGCMDTVTARRLFTHNRGEGLSPDDRIRLIGDLRRSFDACGIGWDYWSYNEAFTVFQPEKRIYGRSPDSAILAPSWFDYSLLETGLGLTPKVQGGRISGP